MAVEKQNTNSALIVTIGGVSTVLLIVIIVGIQGWFADEQQAEIRSKSAMETNWKLADLRMEQQSKINGYRWADKDKQIACIPIEEAIKFTAKRYVHLHREETSPAKTAMGK